MNPLNDIFMTILRGALLLMGAGFGGGAGFGDFTDEDDDDVGLNETLIRHPDGTWQLGWPIDD